MRISNLKLLAVVAGISSFHASAQDALYVSPEGLVGLGTNSPFAGLTMAGDNNKARIVITDTGVDEVQTMFSLVNAGHVKFRMQNSEQSGVKWEFRTFGTEGVDEAFTISRIGTTPEMKVLANGNLVLRGSLENGSSRYIKSNFRNLDYGQVLSKIGELVFQEWTYKDAPSEKHIGPMAEDWHAAFGLGSGNKTVAPSDLAGVALAGTKALTNRVNLLEEENRDLRTRLNRLEAALLE